MALIKCIDCGKEISDTCDSCIHCGCPIKKPIVCSECGKEINSDMKFCQNCGCPIEKPLFCSECGKEISSKAKSCPNCGNSIEKENLSVRKKVFITHEKKGWIGSRLNIFIYIDNQMVGRTTSGKTLDLEMPVGNHYISLEMPVNQANNNSSNISKDAKEFTILESTKEVDITISVKLGWSEGTCNIDEILCK